MRNSSFKIGDNDYRSFSSIDTRMRKAQRNVRIGGAITAFLWFLIGFCWCINLFRLTNCDFEAPYKCEIVHAIGLFPLASPVTMFYPTVDKKIIK